MKLVATVLRRLRDGVIVLWAAASLTFLGMQHSGGDTALAIVGGPDAMPSAELLAQVRAEYGLDQPLWRQYLSYLGRLAQGDLGESYRLRIPVVQAIGERAQHVTDSLASSGGNRNSTGMIVQHRFDSVGIDIDFVHHEHLRNVSGTDFVEHPIDSVDVRLRVSGRSVDDVNEKIGIDHDFKR